jgi:hypothetical protein
VIGHIAAAFYIVSGVKTSTSVRLQPLCVVVLCCTAVLMWFDMVLAVILLSYVDPSRFSWVCTSPASQFSGTTCLPEQVLRTVVTSP